MHQHFGPRKGLADDAFEEVEFGDFDEDNDMPSKARYDSWAEELQKRPFEWRIVYEGWERWHADTIIRSMKRRGCLAVKRRLSNKKIVVLCSVWRFEDEGT
jgi:hypothetical protein